MSFTTLGPGKVRRQDPVIVSIAVKNDHGYRRPQFEVSFSARLMTEMKWSRGDKIEVSVGDGADHGYVRLKPGPHGHTLRLSGTSPRLRLSVRYWGNETKYQSGPCEFRPDTIGRVLTIELPWQKRLARTA